MDTPTSPPGFKAFYLALSSEARAKFAARAGTTVAYIETHLLYARKVPRKRTMDALWTACQEFDARFDRAELLRFFYEGPDLKGRRSTPDPEPAQEAA